MATDLQFPLDPFFVLSKDLLAIAGFDGYFKKINPAGIELLGYTEEELLSTHINELIHPDDREETIRIRNILRNNQDILNFENRYITKNGETIWLLWTSMPIYSKKLVYAAAKNITHIKKQEEDRNTILANLTKINTDMKQLTYRVSHDLRSPVSNLVAAFSLLDESKVKDKETLEFINLLKLSTDSLNDLLNNYVETLTQETDQTNMFETLSLYEVLGKVKTSISSLIKTSGTTISVDFSEFDVVRFNKSYMESIFLNMITNSIKYAHDERKPEIFISTKEIDGAQKLLFTDNGRGFDLEKVKDRIFGMHQKFTDHKDSKGIGLHLVQNQINSLGGTISVESKIDHGSTFIITF